jgi:hypothetical protein
MKVAPRAHALQSDPRCDQVALLDYARKHSKVADFNAVAGKIRTLRNGAKTATHWNLHWADGPGKNHYHFIWTGKRNRRGQEIRRAMTREELNRNVNQWNDLDILRWRKTLRPTKGVGRHKPATVRTRAWQARFRGVTMGWELKSREYGTDPMLAVTFKQQATVPGGRFFVFTLTSMANYHGKMVYFHRAGVPTLLSVHTPKPHDYERTTKPYVTYGGWR